MNLQTQEGEQRDGRYQGAHPESQGRKVRQARLPLGARLGIAAYGLAYILAAFLPETWMSESVWALLFVGCVLWEMVGVFGEKRYRQEPLTRIYRDRLMKLDRWGYLFRVGFLFLFCWWLAHWLIGGF